MPNLVADLFFTKLVRINGDLRGMGDGGTLLTQLQESFVSDGVHLQCTSAAHVVDKEDVIIRWGEWDKGAFRVVHVEDELEESLDKL
jgi:hypothetical protein